MTPYVQDADFTLYCGDALDVLRTLPDASVDCAATSPPFYGLRDYGTGTWEGGDPDCDHVKVDPPPTGRQGNPYGTPPGTNHKRKEFFGAECGKCGARRVDQQIGLEATPEEWCARLVEVFRELRRVLVKTGTLWIECGDSYNSNPWRDRTDAGASGERWQRATDGQPTRERTPGVKPKDLIGAPFLLAFALRADGWWWRSTNIWHKPNCLPESATDRPTVAHSYVFQFSKAARYFHNAEAVREPAEWARWGDQTIVKEQPGKAGWIESKGKNELPRSTPQQDRRVAGFNERWDASEANGTAPTQRNLRSVWTIPTQPFAQSHFATWPEALVERIVKMSCPEQVCRTCGKPREPITDGASYYHERDGTRKPQKYATVGGGHGGVGRGPKSNLGASISNVIGFSDCKCSGQASGNESVKTSTTRRGTAGSDESVASAGAEAGFGRSDLTKYRPGVILDPFLGSGTTALVARRLGRACVGIELNEDYCAMAAERLQQLSLLAEPAA